MPVGAPSPRLPLVFNASLFAPDSWASACDTLAPKVLGVVDVSPLDAKIVRADEPPEVAEWAHLV